MLGSRTEVKVDGVWLRSLGHVAKVDWGTRYGDGPCGPDLASVDVVLEPRNDTGFLRLGRTLQVFESGVLRFGGVISGPGRGIPRTIEAKGWARTAWDATLNPEPGARIGRNARNQTYTPADPTTPRWLLDASDLDIGVADDRLYTRVVGTYVSSLDSEGEPVTSTVTVNDLIAQALYGILPFELDLTPLGVITGVVATNYANQQLAEFAIPEWSSRIVVTGQQLRTLNGHPAHLPDVEAMQMVRMFGLPTSYGGLRRQAATDVVLGETSISTDSPGEITLAPKRVAVRSLADVAREAAEARKVLQGTA